MKYLLVIISFFLLLGSNALCVNGYEHTRPKVAVVLGGGGAKGFAHIGVLKVLQEEGIPVDIVVGTSIGSVVGGIYAMGYSPEEIERQAKTQNWDEFFSDKVNRSYYSFHKKSLEQRYQLSIPMKEGTLSFPKAAIYGHNLLNYFSNLSVDYPSDIAFDSLKVKFAAVATDIETGQMVVMRKGSLATAIYASMAIPGVFAPFLRDGKLLIDGGIVDNFPVDIAKEMGADIVIGVDIRNSLSNKDELKSIPKVLNQLIAFYDPKGDSVKNSLCNVLITPDISGFNNASFSSSSVDSLVKRGEFAVRDNLLQIRALKEKYNLSVNIDTTISKTKVYDLTKVYKIVDIGFATGVNFRKEDILKNMQLILPNKYSLSDINKAIDKLYGRENFEKIYFTLEQPNKDSEDRILKLFLFEKKVYTQNIGFKVNTTDAAAILLNVDRADNSKWLKLWSISAELSTNPGLSVLGEIKLKNFSDLGLKIDGKKQKYSVYDYKEKLGTADLYYASSTLYLYRNFFYMMDMGFSVSCEYFRGDVYLDENVALSEKMEHENLLLDSRFYVSFDNLNDYYFPTGGVSFYTNLSFLRNYFYNIGTTVPVVMFRGKSVVSLSDKMTLIGEAFSRSIYGSENSLFKNTFVGGEGYSVYFNNQFPFVGMNAVTQVNRYSNIAMISSRYNFIRKHYIGLKINVLRSAEELVDFTNCSYVWGVGILYQIKTNMGPFDFTVGYSDYQKLPNVSANLGYWF